VHFEHVIYEGFAPYRVPVMVECLTDNLNRTAPEMRVLFRKGQLGTSGSVAWDFDHVGMIEAEPASAAAGADPELAAIEAGAQDFEPGEEDGCTLFLTDAADLDLVSRALPAQGYTVLSAKLGYKAKNPVDPASLTNSELEEWRPFLPPSTRTTMCKISLRAWQAETDKCPAPKIIANFRELKKPMTEAAENPSLPALPDRLSVDPRSPHYVAAVFEHEIGIRFNDNERRDVEEYCISERWIKVAAGKALDRKGQPLTIKLKGKVEAFYK